jgi:hypothetical protein
MDSQIRVTIDKDFNISDKEKQLLRKGRKDFHDMVK